MSFVKGQKVRVKVDKHIPGAGNRIIRSKEVLEVVELDDDCGGITVKDKFEKLYSLIEDELTAVAQAQEL